jgi:hypothetical protein
MAMHLMHLSLFHALVPRRSNVDLLCSGVISRRLLRKRLARTFVSRLLEQVDCYNTILSGVMALNSTALAHLACLMLLVLAQQRGYHNGSGDGFHFAISGLHGVRLRSVRHTGIV